MESNKNWQIAAKVILLLETIATFWGSKMSELRMEVVLMHLEQCNYGAKYCVAFHFSIC